MVGSSGPKASMQIGKKCIEVIASLYFLNYSSDALVAAVPPCWLVKDKYLTAMVSDTVTSHAKHLPDFHGIIVQPSGRLPSTLETPKCSLVTGIEALENKRHM